MAINGNEVQQTNAEKRHVLVIITGGTICMQDSSNGLVPTRNFVDNCLRRSPDFNDGSPLETTSVKSETGRIETAVTLHSPSTMKDLPGYKYSVFEFAELIDSSSMDGSHWNQILKCITMNWNDFDAFVVLHGTDTMSYTASALSFMLGKLEKTVVVTGSQLSMYVPNNDAHDNLLDALTVAASYIVPEVSVVFHHHLYRGTRVTKVSSFSVAGFTTPNAKPLAVFPRKVGVPWSAHIYSENIEAAPKGNAKQATPYLARLDHSSSHLDTSRVAVLKVYPGISANLISSILNIDNLGGLVMETFGAGNVPMGTGSKGLMETLATAVSDGIVVVSVTQCLTGSVTTAYESARKMELKGIVTGLDMTTEAAYTKLVYLLSLPNLSRADVAKKMRKDMCGELTADFKEGQRRRDSFSKR